MKIDGPKKSQSTGKASSSKKASQGAKTSGSRFADHIAQNASEKKLEEVDASIGGIGSASSIDALLSLQAAPPTDEREARRQAVYRAEDILDHLEEIRIGLLTGDYTKTQLENLAALINKQRGQLDDPRLETVLDEIDLRAQVELAKFGRYNDRT